jgi:signal transduction histidine kinase/ligand-binding sensor domain-containing protein/DNA-binding response OmpR family regulator
METLYLKADDLSMIVRQIQLNFIPVRPIHVVIISCLYIACAAQLPVQTSQYQLPLNRISIDDGLSQNAIRDIVHDDDGFVWIATKNGLNRYDGYTFERFYYDAFDTARLASSNLYSLCMDRYNHLWVGSQGGLDRMNLSTGHIEHVRLVSCPYKQRAKQIRDIQIDAQGRLWIEHTKDGYNIDHEENGLSMITISLAGYDIQPLLCDEHPSRHRVHSIYIDGRNVYVGTKSGLLLFPDGSTDPQLTAFSFRPPVHVLNPNLAIAGIAKDNAGNLWLNHVYGMSKYNIENKSTTHYYCDGNDIHEYYGHINEIAYDPQNNMIYLANYPGFIYFNTERETFSYQNQDEYNPSNVSCIYSHPDGTWWFGTNGGGIFKYSPKQHRFRKFSYQPDEHSRFPDFSIRTIYTEEDEAVWLGSEILYRWNRQSNTLTSYEKEAGDIRSLGATDVWSVVSDEDDILWFGTSEGLYKFNSKDESYLHIHPNNAMGDELPERRVFWVHVTGDGELWILTDSHLCQVDKVTFKMTCHLLYEGLREYANQFGRIYEDAHHVFWINTNHGLVRFNPENLEQKWYTYDPLNGEGLNSDVVRSICPDPDQPNDVLWLGTAGGGLNQFFIKEDRFVHYTVEQGIHDNVIYGVLADELGYLWLSSNNGLGKFNRNNGSCLNFSYRDGLQSNEFNSGAYFKSDKGELFFGGIAGINYFYPDEVTLSSYQPNTVITSFKVVDPKVNPEDLELGHIELKSSERLDLKHNENIFTVHFASLDYNDVSSNRFKYRLTGWMDDFIVEENNNSATFSNVSPGEYIFEVMSTNSDGRWSENKATLAITIHPPWWKTHAAIGCYILLAGLMLYWIRKKEMARIKLDHDLTLERVKAHRLEELDELKSDFFANITHEFRTPLTVILSPLDDLKKQVEGADNIKTLDLIQSNAQRLLELINQIMDLSKVSIGKLPLQLNTQPIQPMLDTLIESHGEVATRKGVKLEMQSSMQNQMLTFDRDVIEKILTNLISNAIKHTPSGGHVICAVELITNADDLQLSLTVTDNGVGISQDDQEKIFNRFYKVEGHHELSSFGTGIGLSLVKELTELMGGEINVTSEPNKGSRFKVRIPIDHLPVLKDETPSEPQNAPYNRGIVPSDSVTGNEEAALILIVEDNEDLRRLIRHSLGPSYQFMEAVDGQDGLEKAMELIPDLIISDIMMPRMDGYKFCEHIKTTTTTCHIPVIMLTAKTSRPGKMSGLQQGADLYLTKPFDAEELRLHVRNQLQHLVAIRRRFSEEKSMHSIYDDLSHVDQDFVMRINTFLKDNIRDEALSPQVIAEEMAVSDRQMRRKLKALTGQSPNQFIRSFRLRAAQELLLAGHPVSKVAYDVGFSSPNYFARCFKDEFGTTAKRFARQQS